jgi:hypothetical protein
MYEVCYCGWAGEIEDRIPVRVGNGERALCCPNPLCGHLEHLSWLPAGARNHTLDEADARQAQWRSHAASSVKAGSTATTQAAGGRPYGRAAVPTVAA